MSGYLQLLRGLRKHASLWDEIIRLLGLLDDSQEKEDAFSNDRQRLTSSTRIRQAIDTILGLLKKVKQYEFAKEVQVCLSCLQRSKSAVDTARKKRSCLHALLSACVRACIHGFGYFWQVRKRMNEAYSVLCRSLASAHMEIDRLQVPT